MVAIKNIVIFAGAVAATIIKRDVATVLSDIDSISKKTDALTSALQGYTGIASSPPILSASSDLKNTVDQAATDAKAVSSASESEQAQILQAVEKLIPVVYNSLTVFEGKSAQFQSDGIATVAQQNLAALKSSTDSLSSALSDKATGDFKTAAGVLSAEIDAAFDAAAKNAPLPATTPVAIPGAGSSGGSTAASAPASTGAASASAPATTPAATSAKATGSTPAAPSSTLSFYTAGAIANGVNFGAAAAAFAAFFL